MALKDKLEKEVEVKKMLLKEISLSLYRSSSKDMLLREMSITVYSTLHEILSEESKGYTLSSKEMDLKEKVMKALILKGYSELYLYSSLIDVA